MRVLQLPPKLDARRQASRICCGRQRLWEPVTAVIVGCRGARSGTLSPAQPLDATAGSAGHSSESMLAQAGAGVDVAPASPLGPVRPGIVALWRCRAAAAEWGAAARHALGADRVPAWVSGDPRRGTGAVAPGAGIAHVLNRLPPSRGDAPLGPRFRMGARWKDLDVGVRRGGSARASSGTKGRRGAFPGTRRPRAPAPPGCACGRPEPRLLSLTARRCDRHGEGDTRHGGRVRGQCRTMTFAAGIVTRRSRRVFPWSGETKRSAPLAVVVKSNGPCRWWSQSSRVRRRGRGTPAAATEAAAAGRAPVPPQAPRPTVTGSADLAISWGTRGRGRSAVPSRMAVVRRTAAPAESVLGRPDRAVPARRSRDVRTPRSWGWPGRFNLNLAMGVG